jgi:probable addiction module antidote protein
MNASTTRWDVTEYLDSDERIAGYLDAVFEDGDPALIKAAIADVARAKGMTEVAAKSGISRAGLYKALGEKGNPSFETMAAIMKAIGVRVAVAV